MRQFISIRAVSDSRARTLLASVVGFNLFVYAANMPTFFGDALGLKPKPGFGAGPNGSPPGGAPPGRGPAPLGDPTSPGQVVATIRRQGGIGVSIMLEPTVSWALLSTR